MMSSVLDLRGKLLHIATNENSPFVSLNYVKSGKTWVFDGGIEVDIFRALSEHFNFTFAIINCNQKWGTLLPNNSWTGIIGEIISEKADLGFAELSITEERSQVVTFSNPHIISSVTFITPYPKDNSNLKLILEPFDYYVWMCVIATIVINLLTKWIISRFTNEEKQLQCNTPSTRQQIFSRYLTLKSLRMLMIILILGQLILTLSYGGCLYSIMTVPSYMKAIDTLEELAIAQNNGRIQVIAVDGSSHLDFFKKSNFGVFKEIGKYIKPVESRQKAYDLVANSTKAFAYISIRDTLNDDMNRFGKKTFYLPPKSEGSTINIDFNAIAMQKNFEFKKEFNYFISDLIKGGFIDYWRLLINNKFLKNKKKVSSDHISHREDPQHESIHLKQLQSALYLYIIAIIVSFLLFLVELFIRLNSFRKCLIDS